MEPLSTLAQVHSALQSGSLKSYPSQPHAKWTPLQHRLFYYNRAILQLRANQIKDCLNTIEYLRKELQPLSNAQKKKRVGQVLLQVTDPTDLAWWETRLAVLTAHAKQDTSGFSTIIQQWNGVGDSSVKQDALLFLELHRAHLENVKTPLELLEGLASTKPAVLASQATLYQAQGNADKASECLRATHNPQALAHFAMAIGNYQQAATLYETSAKNDPVLTARWIQALSYTDPDRAIKEWSNTQEDLKIDDNDGDLETLGAQLEERKLPRLGRSMAVAMVTPAKKTTDGKKRRSHEAVLRHRARKREAYLKKLEEKGTNITRAPDPERWTPKYERSYNARRRRKQHYQQHRGAQGGVSEKDAAKLDVVARKEARERGEFDPQSTAHIAVSSSGTLGRKGGRRR